MQRVLVQTDGEGVGERGGEGVTGRLPYDVWPMSNLSELVSPTTKSPVCPRVCWLDSRFSRQCNGQQADGLHLKPVWTVQTFHPHPHIKPVTVVQVKHVGEIDSEHPVKSTKRPQPSVGAQRGKSLLNIS